MGSGSGGVLPALSDFLTETEFNGWVSATYFYNTNNPDNGLNTGSGPNSNGVNNCYDCDYGAIGMAPSERLRVDSTPGPGGDERRSDCGGDAAVRGVGNPQRVRVDRDQQRAGRWRRRPGWARCLSRGWGGRLSRAWGRRRLGARRARRRLHKVAALNPRVRPRSFYEPPAIAAPDAALQRRHDEALVPGAPRSRVGGAVAAETDSLAAGVANRLRRRAPFDSDRGWRGRGPAWGGYWCLCCGWGGGRSARLSCGGLRRSLLLRVAGARHEEPQEKCYGDKESRPHTTPNAAPSGKS